MATGKKLIDFYLKYLNLFVGFCMTKENIVYSYKQDRYLEQLKR